MGLIFCESEVIMVLRIIKGKKMNKIKTTLSAFSTVAGGVLMAIPVAAKDTNPSAVKSYVNPSSQKKVTGSDATLMQQLQLILNVALGVIGFVAVVMIVVGGLQYTTSSGDTGKVTKAKNTIMYGVIGLVVALLAFAIVNFVLTNIF